MSTTTTSIKVDPVLWKQVRERCFIFRFTVSSVVSGLLRKWLVESESQSKLEPFIPGEMPRTRPIVVNIHADSVDVIALKARVSQVKVELRSSLRIIERTKDRTFWRQQLEKNLREAARLHGPRDKELQELVAQAEKWFDLDPS